MNLFSRVESTAFFTMRWIHNMNKEYHLGTSQNQDVAPSCFSAIPDNSSTYIYIYIILYQ